VCATSMERHTTSAREETVVPQDARTVQKILQSMNVEEYEPRVVQQLLDFMYRHVNEVLEDAEVRVGESEDEGKETRRDEMLEA